MFFKIFITLELMIIIWVEGLPTNQLNSQQENQINIIDWSSVCYEEQVTKSDGDSPSISNATLILNAIKELKIQMRRIKDELTKYKISKEQRQMLDQLHYKEKNWLPSNEERNFTFSNRTRRDIRLLDRLYINSEKFAFAFFVLWKVEDDDDEKVFLTSIIKDLNSLVCALRSNLFLIKLELPKIKIEDIPQSILNPEKQRTFRLVHFHNLITKFKKFIKRSLKLIRKFQKSIRKRLLRKSQTKNES